MPHRNPGLEAREKLPSMKAKPEKTHSNLHGRRMPRLPGQVKHCRWGTGALTVFPLACALPKFRACECLGWEAQVRGYATWMQKFRLQGRFLPRDFALASRRLAGPLAGMESFGESICNGS